MSILLNLDDCEIIDPEPTVQRIHRRHIPAMHND